MLLYVQSSGNVHCEWEGYYGGWTGTEQPVFWGTGCQVCGVPPADITAIGAICRGVLSRESLRQREKKEKLIVFVLHTGAVYKV